jgi:PAS domain S-box-containing protein
MDILWDDGERVLSRGQRFGKRGSEKVLVARPSSDQPLLATLNRLTHEFALKEELKDEWAVRPIELLREGDQTILLLDDPGGEPLARVLGAPVDTTAFLRLAISIAAALGKLHQSGLVHKDIKPTHIFVNCADGEARFTGFGLTSRLPRERQTPETIAGTLAYMAPEQTGRMNRSIDSRSDLYSFGVILYQMLTAELPFTASEPMEWVHCHIARKPVPPSLRLETVPEPISRIVMKLLAKTAEDRYQTAVGIERDLQRCLSQWSLQRSISDFPLDEQGWSERLLIPEKLYGREDNIEQLVSAFGRVAEGSAPECVLVTGYSGIGKSSLVSELHKVLVPSRGLLACGKFDQYKRDIPYSALVQALQGLVRTLLGKSDTELDRWRTPLLEALDLEGRLITDLIPELKLIIGEQPLVSDLEPHQAQRRLLLVFERFIGAFAQEAHPLVLFLDDLQWLDSGTLELIEDVLSRSALRHFLLIGAYRDNEVATDHPLKLKLQRLRNSAIPIHEITLTPLALEHIEELIGDALHTRPQSIRLLAQLVFDKTAGSPFFVIQFLHALAEEKLLNFDQGHWHWDSARIHAKGYTDNVVDLMVDKLNRLPLMTLEGLQHMACLGNAVDISTLATAMVISRSQLHKVLWVAIRQELIERLDGVYVFAHDRIHEAAYSLIPADLLSVAHLKIGRLLVAKTPAEKHEEVIFDIVGQLNRGALLITEPAEREQLARFNLIAGQRSNASTAYDLALKYFTMGAQLMRDQCWSHWHELKFKLELSRAECELLTGKLLVADQRLRTLAGQAVTIVERGDVACMLMSVNLLLDRNDQAVAICLAFLRHVGVDWSAHPSDEVARSEYEGIWSSLGDQPIEQIIDLPPMEDAVALSTLHALTMLFSPALHTDANLACLTICKAINLSLEYGNCDASSVAYANLSLVTGQRFGNYQMGFRFGQLGCQLVDRRNLARYEARTYLSFALFVARWAQPVRSCRGLLDRAFDAANRIGDYSYGAFACNIIVSNLLFAGEPLPELQLEAERRLAYAQKVQFGLVIDFIEIQLALIRMLRGLTPVFGCLDSEQFNESEAQSHVSRTSPVLTCCYWIRKLQARYLAGDLTCAIEAGAQAQPLLEVSHSFLEEAEYYLYDALARAGLCSDASSPDQQEHLMVLKAHHMKMNAWADICSENFASHKALVGAEIARIENRLLVAEHLYEVAIDSAQQSGFVHIGALANEQASRFYAARGLTKIARLYMRDARYGYLRWGADGKVRQLEAVYKYLRVEEPTFGPAITITTPVEQLDLATVLKVSQAVSGEIVLEKLIDMIMSTAIEQAGAERGLMVSIRGNDPRIIAEATIGNNSPLLQLHLRDVPVSATLLPEGILYHVLRTHESVVLDNAISQPQYAADPYILEHRARSILCLPLMNQARLIGALFLENNLTAGVFSPARIAVLKLVASQAAISLENAHLYRDVAESEAKIRRLVDSNIIGVIFWNADGEITDANDAFLNMVGYEREDIVSGRIRWRDLTAPQYRAESEKTLLETLRNGSARPFEKEYIRKDGSLLPILIGLATFEAGCNEGVAFVLDLTERKHAQDKARQSEQRYRNIQVELAHANRVATMGQLAASIAHEVSQPIAATAMGAHAALRWMGAQPPNLDEIKLVLQNLVKDARRAADVLDRIRGHIRKAPPQKGAMEVAGIIHDMVDFTRGQAISHCVSVQTRIAENLPSVLGDRIELQQVLLNLILNAFEAMNTVDDTEKRLTISAGMEEQGSVLVQVSDTGPGFDSGQAEQVFTAFYTTKATGLGMGLSICRSIMEAHGGRLWASSNQPRGAIIQFTLPPHTGA